MANTPQGGGIRPPDYMREMAIGRVEDLMVQAMPWKRIIAILSDEGYTESEQTAKGWRQEVQRRWAAEDAEARPARKDLWRARLEALYNELLAKASVAAGHVQAMLYGEAIKIAKVSIVMDGLTQPIARATDGTVPVAAMSPLERERKIAELLAKREAARAAGN